MTAPLSRLSEDDEAVMGRLCSLHDQEKPTLERYDRWYEGTERVQYMHDEIFRESGRRIPEVRIALPRIAVDAIAEREYVQGIRSGVEELDAEFLRIWLANQMDLGFSQAVVDSLVFGRSFISVGTNEYDKATPILMPESPLELVVRLDPRTRRVVEGLRRWCVYDNTGTLTEEYATLYLPGRTIWLERKSGWAVTDRDDHGLTDEAGRGVVPLAVLANRPRSSMVMTGANGSLRERIGRSELSDVIPLAHSANKLATDMMVAAERVAIPLRALFGAGPDEFKDEKGNPMTPMQALMGGLLAIPESDVKAFEFAAAQLSNFTTAMREVSNQAGAVTGLPPHYLGTPSDNPASAEAIIGAESRLIMHAELKQVPLGIGVIDTANLAHRFAAGDWSPELRTAKVDWRDVRTPTVGARADAAQKLFAGKILPLRKVREELGYTDDEIDVMEEWDEADAASSPAGRLANAMVDSRVG